MLLILFCIRRQDLSGDELRSTLVRDAFEYLTLKMVPAWSDRRQGEELLEVICRAAEPLPPQSIEIVAGPLPMHLQSIHDFSWECANCLGQILSEALAKTDDIF